MDMIVNMVAVVGLTGVAALTVLSGGVGVIMPLLILVGVIDGQTGGKLDDKAAAAKGAPVGTSHGERHAA